MKAVSDGLIKESEIDTSLQRLFTARFRLGMFDPPGNGPFPQHSSFPDRLAGTSPAGASGGA